MTRAALILALLCAGCALNRASLTETLLDPATGQATSRTRVETTVLTVAGSKAADGAGKVTYEATRSGAWKLEVGQSAHGLEAGGEPADVIREASPSLLKLLDLWVKP